MSLLSVRAVGKAFRVYSSEWHRIANWFGFKIKPAEEHWVLSNINFEIQAGESIGIIGQNGAGKSTLLKMITGTLQPTEGQIHINGRIAAILELGMGFNPELTGRQNVLHLAGLMGHSAEQIQKVMPEIESFAEIGEYFDEPVRVYSSGMQMRVAFSVATVFQPEILIIDEALSVGDAYFQQKCFYQIEQYKKKGGTLLFVSHDINTVKSLCDRAILIDQGKLISEGSPKDVIDFYHAIIAKKSDLGHREVSFVTNMPAHTTVTKASSITTNGDAELLEFKLLNKNNQEVTYIESETELTVRYKVRLKKYFERPAFGLIIRNKIGQSMFETSSYAMNIEQAPIQEESIVCVSFSFLFNLRFGQYSFSIGVSNKGYARSEFEEISLLMHDVEQIQVIESAEAIFYGGVYNMSPKLEIMVL